MKNKLGGSVLVEYLMLCGISILVITVAIQACLEFFVDFFQQLLQQLQTLTM